MMNKPTPYPELNFVLQELVNRELDILRENVVGIYIQGSFAVGDGDEDSDIDVVVVIHEQLSDEIVPTLNQMHQALHDDIEGYWSKHLEGSYFPANLLKTLTPNQPLLHYFDNGSTTLELDDHDNTLVVRWCMREYGIALYGPPATSLIDEVSADALKDEVREVMVEWGKQLLANQEGFNGRWRQSSAVVSYCRMVHTLETGRVHSKLASTMWAKENMAPEWHDFIQRAQDNRKGQFLSIRPLNHPEDTKRTPDFLKYCCALVGEQL